MGAIEAFEKLNERQREAATAGQRAACGAFQSPPLLILAGSGTGKTNTLAHRVAHLLLQGIDAERILLLTFTRRAALEMTRRAQRVVRATGTTQTNVRLPWSGTFHSVANRLIRRNCHRVGLDERFSVLDRGDAADLLDVVRHELGYSKVDGENARRFPRKDTCLAIYSHRVNTQGTLEATLRHAFPCCEEWVSQLNALFLEYTNKKIANQSLDYDDLLLYWHAMMADAALAREIGKAWDHVLVDEYQDTNVLQAEILQRLRPTGEGLTVVGDDAQSIYSFRAAAVENILNFKNSFENTTTILLEENYRSTQEVLDSANALMGKNLYSRKSKGAGALRGDARAGSARAGHRFTAPGGAVPLLAPLGRAGAGTRAAEHSLREVRRPQVPRGGAREGRVGPVALGGQPEEPRRGLARAAAPAGSGADWGRENIHGV